MSKSDLEHSREELKDLGFGPYQVNFVDSFIFDLKNDHLSWFHDHTQLLDCRMDSNCLIAGWVAAHIFVRGIATKEVLLEL